MSNGSSYRRRSITGALILIAIGALFLYANLRPEFDPWSVFSRYWPLILIFWGLGRIVDYFMFERSNVAGAGNRGPHFGGEAAAIIVVFILFVVAMAHFGRHAHAVHEQKSLDLQDAKSLNVSVELPAGELDISGDAPAAKALEGDFNYHTNEGEPRVDYNVSGDSGKLSITEADKSITTHFGTTKTTWKLQLNSSEPTDLKTELGAGRTKLKLRGMNLGRVDVEMGAGELEADLGGDWKRNVDMEIQGGVGSATIRLPKSVGVEVSASGGLGSVSAEGLKDNDGSYVNDLFGKSPVTVHVQVSGGVGHIKLVSE
jgi:hypothetical protein